MTVTLGAGMLGRSSGGAAGDREKAGRLPTSIGKGARDDEVAGDDAGDAEDYGAGSAGSPDALRFLRISLTVGALIGSFPGPATSSDTPDAGTSGSRHISSCPSGSTAGQAKAWSPPPRSPTAPMMSLAAQPPPGVRSPPASTPWSPSRRWCFDHCVNRDAGAKDAACSALPREDRADRRLSRAPTVPGCYCRPVFFDYGLKAWRMYADASSTIKPWDMDVRTAGERDRWLTSRITFTRIAASKRWP